MHPMCFYFRHDQLRQPKIVLNELHGPAHYTCLHFITLKTASRGRNITSMVKKNIGVPHTTKKKRSAVIS